ncbi:Astrotactin-2 [Sigmodon hispidus]
MMGMLEMLEVVITSPSLDPALENIFCKPTERENNFVKDFPQLADGLVVIPLPVEEQCRGVLSEPLPDLQLLTGDIRYDEAMGYPMVQQWRVRSNLYRVKLSTITLSSGFTNVLKILTKESSRDEMLSFIQHYGSHYIAEALYGSELTCIIHFPSKKVQQQLWLQYQKGGDQVCYRGKSAEETMEPRQI